MYAVRVGARSRDHPSLLCNAGDGTGPYKFWQVSTRPMLYPFELRFHRSPGPVEAGRNRTSVVGVIGMYAAGSGYGRGSPPVHSTAIIFHHYHFLLHSIIYLHAIYRRDNAGSAQVSATVAVLTPLTTQPQPTGLRHRELEGFEPSDSTEIKYVRCSCRGTFPAVISRYLHHHLQRIAAHSSSRKNRVSSATGRIFPAEKERFLDFSPRRPDAVLRGSAPARNDGRSITS